MEQNECQLCDGQHLTDSMEPGADLVQVGIYEASTVDGGFSAEEYQCKKCGKTLQHYHGIAAEGWNIVK